MAEHDDIVRKAAEATVRAITDDYRYRPEVPTPKQMARVLIPFFAAARKEAREGALAEAIGAGEALRLWNEGGTYRRDDVREGACEVLDAIRALRTGEGR